MRTKAAGPAILLASIALGGCSDRATGSIPAEGPWTVGLSSNDHAVGVTPALQCFEDEAVSESFAALDMPGSGASGTIGADRTPSDVQRLVDCVKLLAPHVEVGVVSQA